MLNFIKVWSFRLATAFSIVFAILYSIFLLISIPYGYFLGPQWADSPDWTLRRIVNSVLEVPYQEKRDFVIDRPEYIKTLSQEEWMNVNCKIRDFHKSDMVIGAKNYEHLPEEQKWHLNCISPIVVSKFGTGKTVNGELCSNIYNCQLLSLAVNHYVFQHPEILWSIIKIAERPCDFIKKFDQKVLDNPGDLISVVADARQARRELCSKDLLSKNLLFPVINRESRKFVLITIQDIENKRIMDIIVRRTDID
jgi:hypothetical protein